MTSLPQIDEILAVMSDVSKGNLTSRVQLPKRPPQGDQLVRIAVSLNNLLDKLSGNLMEGRQFLEMQAIFDQMHVLVLKVDLDGRLLLANQRACKALGFSKQNLSMTQFLDGPWWDFDPKVQERVGAAFTKACSGGAVSYDEQILLNKKIETIRLRLTPMTGRNGQVESVLVEGEDITEYKEIEQSLQLKTIQLEAANKELDAFSYSVSHDLRSPLRSIDGFSHALLEDYRDVLPEDGVDYLTRVRSAAQRMALLIDDLLNLSRTTRLPMNIVAVDLGKLTAGIAEQLRKNYPDHKVELSVEENLVVQGDAHLLQVVLENLLSNAWKFTSKKEQGIIEVGATEEDGETVFYVRDNGAGFDMAYVNKLFDAFQRLHGVKDFPGTGVGLATVHRIIKRHGGRIWAEAEVDIGAAFYFTLPEMEDIDSDLLPEEDSIARRAKELI